MSNFSKMDQTIRSAVAKKFTILKKTPLPKVDKSNSVFEGFSIPPHPSCFETMDRILLASDFLMTKESEQDSNLRWLSDLYAIAIEQGAGAPVAIASKYFNLGWGFDRAQFFELSGIVCDPLDTHFYFDPSQLSQEAITYFRSFVPKSTLVIGYELSINTRAFLDLVGIRYIDVWLGPIRFLDDLTFAFYSNDPSINTALDRLTVTDSYVRAQAAVLKVQSYRGFSKKQHYIRDNSALFAGQMLADKALLLNGRMLSLLDFKQEFESITKQYSTVYYARHPFLKDGDEEILAFVKSFRNVQVSSETGYMVLCDENLKAVYGITSSLVVEASYFVAKTCYLSKPMYEISKDAERKYRLVMQQPMFSEFWNSLLSGGECAISCLELGKDKLRDALSFYWSYRQIDKLEFVRAIASKHRKC